MQAQVINVECQRLVDDTVPAWRDALDGLKMMTKKEIDEVMLLTNPPPPTPTVPSHLYFPLEKKGLRRDAAPAPNSENVVDGKHSKWGSCGHPLTRRASGAHGAALPGSGGRSTRCWPQGPTPDATRPDV